MTEQLLHSPTDIVRRLLIALDLGTLPSDDGDWPIYIQYEPDTPANLVALFDTTGLVEGFHQWDGSSIDRHGLQALVRSDDWNTGYRKAVAIRNAFDNDLLLNDLDLSISGYLLLEDGFYFLLETGYYLELEEYTAVTYTVWSVTRSSSILPIGGPTPLGDKHYRFSINALARITSNL